MTQLTRYIGLAGMLAIVVAWPQGSTAGLFDKISKGLTGPKAQEKACQKGTAEQCTSLGYRYLNGNEVPKDLNKAGNYLQRGCEGGHQTACHELYSVGFKLLHGKRGFEKNIGTAQRFFHMACEGGARAYSGSACHELAKLDLRKNSTDTNAIAGLLRRACDGGSRRGCHTLGEELLSGKRLQRDVPKALAALARACKGEKKVRAACASLGRIYNEGKLVKRDVARAELYLNGACTFPGWSGHGCYALALLYEKELRGKKSDKEIADLYHIACHRAERDRMGDACIAAAKMHQAGRGAEKDDNWVNELYNRGCQLKHKQSCRLSCERNCRLGQPFACEALKKNRIPLGATNCYKL